MMCKGILATELTNKVQKYNYQVPTFVRCFAGGGALEAIELIRPLICKLGTKEDQSGRLNRFPWINKRKQQQATNMFYYFISKFYLFIY